MGGGGGGGGIRFFASYTDWQQNQTQGMEATEQVPSNIKCQRAQICKMHMITRPKLNGNWFIGAHFKTSELQAQLIKEWVLKTVDPALFQVASSSVK